MPSYRLIGGRDLDWNYTDTIPADYNLDTGAAIDLEAFAQGLNGQSVTIFYADDANGTNASETRGDRPFRALVEHEAGTTPTAPTSGYDMINGEAGADGTDGSDGAPAFNGSVSISTSPIFEQFDTAAWPTRSCVATVTFTDGTTTVTETYTVNVDSSGDLSGAVSDDNDDITIATETTDNTLAVTWTHTDGASTSTTFRSVARQPRNIHVDVMSVL